MKNFKTNHLVFFLSFTLWSLFSGDPVLCESMDSSNEENLLSNEKSQKLIIMTGVVIFIAVVMIYFTGENFSDRFDEDTVNTVVKTVTNIAKEIPHKRTEAERIAFLRTYHVGLNVPSYR